MLDARHDLGKVNNSIVLEMFDLITRIWSCEKIIPQLNSFRVISRDCTPSPMIPLRNPSLLSCLSLLLQQFIFPAFLPLLIACSFVSCPLPPANDYGCLSSRSSSFPSQIKVETVLFTSIKPNRHWREMVDIYYGQY
ncbi:hypothetical protein CI102_10935 [Trichoderma harzianum]|uniref:Uncharacterized protein n=1 Tax=Trichoderma harzianum CBS 226.95 TaxID=983964 RepID=A0A2T4ANW9_TRIHA|nr:hypothetical protein M431DRAFT_285483 [Trichoderma harzianum CBS 226.95]PKK46269.1 hypothetical protein CI102_10935 [Trichoderma harzianum]PTB58761.1 hypothetical protein M431DRAFT_285483 [Trichoderma harzianum CBS 226.95]